MIKSISILCFKLLATRLISISLVCFLLVSCSPNYEKIFEENNSEFKERKESFDKIIDIIKKEHLPAWKKQNNFRLTTETSPENLRELMEELGIGSLSFENRNEENCEVNFSITFEVTEGWNVDKLRVVHIFYDPCNGRSLKNQHYYDGYHIDIWGQGDGWGILSDTDFI